MTEAETQPVTPPEPPWFQFSLRTLLLLFVVLGSSLAVFGPWGVVVFALTMWLATYVRDAESLSSLAYFFLIVLCGPCLASLLPLPAGVSRESSSRSTCANNMKQIALALQNYHAANGCFPPAYMADRNGKPMHSWRVLLLPYLNQAALYKAYDFTEPWDGPKNKKLSAMRPQVFACPSDPSGSESGTRQTSYVAVVGPDAAWTGDRPRKLGDVSGKESDSIMLVEVSSSTIAWSEPRDLSLDTLRTTGDNPVALDVMGHHGRHASFFFTYDYHDGVNVAMINGSVRFVPYGGLSAANLRKILPIGACLERKIEWYLGNYDETRQPNWPNIAALAVWLLAVGTLLTHAVRSRRKLSVPPSPLAC